MDNSNDWAHRRNGARKRSMRDYLLEYCRRSGIHGLQYIGEEHRPLLERLLWLAAFLLSLTASLFLICKVWQKWEHTPVIVALEERTRPVWQIPFPAVTVCPQTKFRASLYNQTDLLIRREQGNITEDELRFLDDNSLVCPIQARTEWGRNTTDKRSIETIEKMAPQLESVIMILQWADDPTTRNSTEFFQPLLTDEGLCFSYNMLPGAKFFPQDTFHGSSGYLGYEARPWEWAPDSGYEPSAGMDTHPRRALGAGMDTALSFWLGLETRDLHYMCDSIIQGFKIYLHSPAEFPLVRKNYFHVGLEHEVLVSVTPHVMTTAPGLHSYSPQRRQCYFSSERQLRFFAVYTQQNCALECLANYTLTECGCVAFYMPRELDTPICGSKRMMCVKKVPRYLLEMEVNQGLQSGHSRPQCNCLQSCMDIQYQSERSQTENNIKDLFPVFSDRLKLSHVSIFLKDTQFIASRRGELYGPTDFLANCGGLLGFGMGISVLSLVELLYWLCLRVWSPRRRQGHHQ